MATPKKPITLHVKNTKQKKTVSTRTNTATAVTTCAATSAFCQANPEVKNAVAAVTIAGSDLADAETTHSNAKSGFAAAGAALATKLLIFDQTYDVLATTAEKHATTPEDLLSIALTPRGRTLHPLLSPLSVAVIFDPKKEEIHIRVKQAPGKRPCVIEISSDPIGAATWTRLSTFGAVQTLTGYPPGTYWIRAASGSAKALSPWTTPVSVIVK